MAVSIWNGGSDSRLTASIAAGPALATCSIACWVSIEDASNFSEIWVAGDPGSNDFRLFSTPSAPIQFRGAIGAFDNLAISATVTTSTWNHVVATYDGSTYRIYLNGTVTSSAAAGVSNTVNSIRFGSFAVLGGYAIQDFMMFNRVLSAAEVLAQMRQRKPAAPDLRCWYPFFFPGYLPDFSGGGSTLTVDFGTPGNAAPPPVGWGGPLLRAVSTSVGPTALVGSGTSPSSGAAALTQALPLVGAGTSPSAGVAALLAALPLVGAGTSPSSGTAAITSALPLVGAGTSPTAGDAALTVVSGSDLVASGVTTTAGAAALSAALPLVASGSSPSAGAASLLAALPLVGAGVSPSSGVAALTVSSGADLVADGGTQTSAACALTLVHSAVADGTSRTAGAATLTLTMSLVASGVTQSYGVATLSGVPEPEGDAYWGRSSIRRRYMEGSPRRKVR